MGQLNPGLAAAAVLPALDAMRALELDGVVDRRIGTDLGLREGNFDYVLTFDFEDEAAYRAYDQDEEHNRIRRELFAPVSAQTVRIQIAI
jgi:hypothetical protein